MPQYRHATTSIIILTVIVIICQEIRKLKSLLVGHWKAFYLIFLSFSLNIYRDYVPSPLQSILTHTIWFCAFTTPKRKYYHLFFTSRPSERVIILSFPKELESGAALWLHVWGFTSVLEATFPVDDPVRWGNCSRLLPEARCSIPGLASSGLCFLEAFFFKAISHNKPIISIIIIIIIILSLK